MTVSTTLNKIIYTGDGATTAFPFTFPVVSAANLQVFFTDLNGVITQQFTGFTVTLNPAVSPNPTAAGGTVTFSSPPTLNFKVTLLRTLSLTQNTSLANQGTLYQPVTEAALDYEVMLSQQVLEVQNRALVVPVSDPTPGPLPAVAARANGVLGFDSSGNPITVTTVPAGVISGAMAPVVNAATLAAGRTAFGLGTCATENIGNGLQDDGAGNLQVSAAAIQDSTPQTINKTHHLHHHFATGAVTYTFGATTTFFNGFQWSVSALTLPVTLAINAGDNFVGMSTGASAIVPAGAQATINTNATGQWFISWQYPTGFGTVRNLQINATVAASALTIALKDSNGNDPSVSSPVVYGVEVNGVLTQRVVTTPLSITIPSGATIGTVNAQSNRIWVGLFDNAGTPVLGVYNSLSGTTILCWDETTAINTTNISAGSTLAQTWYTNGALTGKAFRIIGYVESIQATAGTWVTSPSKIQLFGPGVKKPGDVVQSMSNFAASASGPSISIVMVSAANAARVLLKSILRLSGIVADTITTKRGGTTLQTDTVSNNAAAVINFPWSNFFLDTPNTAGSVTYAMTDTTGSQSSNSAVAEEIQI